MFSLILYAVRIELSLQCGDNSFSKTNANTVRKNKCTNRQKPKVRYARIIVVKSPKEIFSEYH